MVALAHRAALVAAAAVLVAHGHVGLDHVVLRTAVRSLAAAPSRVDAPSQSRRNLAPDQSQSKHIGPLACLFIH